MGGGAGVSWKLCWCGRSLLLFLGTDWFCCAASMSADAFDRMLWVNPVCDFYGQSMSADVDRFSHRWLLPDTAVHSVQVPPNYG